MWILEIFTSSGQNITSRGKAQMVLEILNIKFFCMDGLIRMNRDKFQCLLETLPLIWFIYLFLKVSCENGTSEFNIFINKRKFELGYLILRFALNLRCNNIWVPCCSYSEYINFMAFRKIENLFFSLIYLQK